ncbi:MAG: phosphodiesterase [Thalassobaculales bacterium]
MVRPPNPTEPAMLIAQFTDMHVQPRDVLTFGEVHTAGHLERAVAHVNSLPDRPDCLLLTGDLTNDGLPEQVATLKEILAGLTVPYYLVPGNHDHRELLRDAFGHLGYLPAAGRLNYVIERHPLRLIGMDSLVDGHHHGELGAEAIAWLDARLAEQPGRPTVLFFHHPPFATGIDRMDSTMLRDHGALAEVIGRHRQVERILLGHMHRPIQARFAGTIASTCAGTAHQVALRFGKGEGLRRTAEPPMVQLHWWNGAMLVTHTTYVDSFGGLSTFHDNHTRIAAG